MEKNPYNRVVLLAVQLSFLFGLQAYRFFHPNFLHTHLQFIAGVAVALIIGGIPAFYLSRLAVRGKRTSS